MKGRFVRVLFLVLAMLVLAVGVVSAAGPGQVEQESWFKEFIGASIRGVPIFLVVFVVVEVFKKLKQPDGQPMLNGNATLLLSFGMGLVLGIGYIMWQTQPPGEGYAVFQYWFAAAIFGLLMGGAPAIFYDRLKALIENVLQKYLSKYQGPVL